MKASSKLLLSVAALVMALSVATTSTFAWFSTNANPKVGAFDMTAQAGEGVKIGLMKSGVTYVGTNMADTNFSAPAAAITSDQIAAVLANDLKLAALASTDGATFETLATSSSDNKVTGTYATAAANTYASFTLRFFSSAKMDISFDPTASSVTNPSENVVKKVTAGVDGTFNSQTIKPTTEVDAKIQDALRISFVPGSKTAAGTSASVNYAPSTGTYDVAYGADGSDLKDTTKSLAWAMFLHNMGYDGQDVTGVTLKAAEATHATTSQKIGTSVERESTKDFVFDVTVNVWIDGWDADCFDSVLGQMVSVALGFAGATATV